MASFAWGDLDSARRAWLDSVNGLLGGRDYHYRFSIVIRYDDPDVEKAGRFLRGQETVCEIGRLGERAKVVARTAGGRTTTCYDGKGVFINTEAQKYYTVYTEKFSKDDLLKVGLPLLDPFAEVLGLPVPVAAPQWSIPRSVSENYDLESALQLGYRTVNETASRVEFILDGRDQLVLSKDHGHQIVTRTCNGSDGGHLSAQLFTDPVNGLTHLGHDPFVWLAAC